jgi:hypothetical protein
MMIDSTNTLNAQRLFSAGISISDLRSSLKGQVIVPGNAEYDAARTPFYGGFDRHPALVVRPADASDVTRVVIGYLGAATLLCSLLYWLYRSPLEAKDVPVKPGSTEEMELQLASGDEAG